MPILRPNLLCTVPPFSSNTPPAGPASLLGYLKANGCDDFGFLDLQLWMREVPLPYALVGAFGESFVRDVPELPLVLRLLRASDSGQPLAPARDPELDAYCYERMLDPAQLVGSLGRLDALLARFVAEGPPLELVGFTVWSSNYLTTLLAAAHLKRLPNPPLVIAGGPQVTESDNAARLALRSGLVDLVVLSEGEQTLLEIHRARSAGRSLRGIAGTLWLEADGRFGREERRALRLGAERGERLGAPGGVEDEALPSRLQPDAHQLLPGEDPALRQRRSAAHRFDARGADEDPVLAPENPAEVAQDADAAQGPGQAPDQAEEAEEGDGADAHPALGSRDEAEPREQRPAEHEDQEEREPLEQRPGHEEEAEEGRVKPAGRAARPQRRAPLDRRGGTGPVSRLRHVRPRCLARDHDAPDPGAPAYRARPSGSG